MGLFITLVDTSIVATSLHSIGVEFGEPQNLNWVALAYTLAYLSCAVTFTRISDIVGRRVAFMAAEVIFFAFSLGCGFAQSLTQLIIFRALQGLGGSGLYSLSMVILPELVPEDLERYMGGVIGLVLAGSGVLGPVLGGILTNYASWRWIFWVNGPICVASVTVFWLAWPKPEQLPTLQRRKWREFDVVGSLLLISAAVLVVFALQNAGHTVGNDGKVSWDKMIFILPMVFGLLSWVALVIWSMIAQRHLQGRCLLTFPVSLFQNRQYAAATLSTLFMGFPYLLIIFSFPLRAQLVSGKGPLMAGVMLLPMLGSTAVGTAIAGRINSTKNRLCETMTVGAAFMILACGLLTMVGGPRDDGKGLGFLVFAGLGFGLSTAAATMVVSTEAPIEDYGKIRHSEAPQVITNRASTCSRYTSPAAYSRGKPGDSSLDRLRGG